MVRATALALIFALAASAAAAEQLTASNGTVVTKEERAYRPFVDFLVTKPVERPQYGEAYVSALIGRREAGETHLLLQAISQYRGEWRFYDRAYLASGERVEIAPGERDVLRCSGRVCTYREVVQLSFSPDQVESAAIHGLDVQIDSPKGTPFVLTYTASEVAGLLEVSAR